ncbi:hypothetical protein FE257_007528 [Aspergillus nanangensis]|uniref:Uncharacterized protein n=1 Tax=Aspergillus nanangensis TaxID=2582783 RepID=A0AAD4CMG1_ASPNN|nr:hypothetical protein FE257_007528 [Aspergillus nanangensis]
MKLLHLGLSTTVLGLAVATPVAKRAVTDADILNYALTLEHLEAAFYEQGLANYTQEDFIKAGFQDPFYTNLQQVAADEKSHEEFLTQALSGAGASPVERCTYAFPVTDVKSFLTLANVLEGVGVSAYLGAAAHIMNDTYLTAAGSILTVEARHSAYLRAAMGELPAAQPFDNPLDFNEVYTVASPFIASCPSSNQALPVKAFPSLMMSPMMSTMTGQTVHLVAGEGMNSADDIHAAFITVTGPVWAPVTSQGDGKFTVTIPKGVMGQSYVVLTKGNTQATDDNIVAGPAILEVGRKSTGMSGSMSAMPTMSSMPTGSMASGTPTMKASASMSGTGSPMFTGGANRREISTAGVAMAGCLGLFVFG